MSDPVRSSSLFSLAGRRVVVTGGTRGIGASIAKGIAAAGGDVCLIGLELDAIAQQTIADCEHFGVTACAIACDLSAPIESWLDPLMQQIDTKFGAADCLCNNAGICIDIDFLQMDIAAFQQTIAVNLSAGFFLTQAFARRWIESQTPGRVVFTGSINGILAEPTHTAYDASKGAVAALVRSLCASLAGRGIRVNSMAPGLVRTPLTAAAIDDVNIGDWMRHHTPNGRVPDADVCAGTVVYLLSDAATHVHGQTVYVDGGMSAWQQPLPN